MVELKSLSWVLLFTLFLLRLANLQAQAPGYLGFNSHLQGDISSFLAIRPFTQDKDSSININLRYGAHWEQVISRRFSVGASMHRLSTSFWYEDEAPFGKGKLESWDMGIFIRMYSFRKRGNIAPIGQYQQLEVLYLSYQLTDVDRLYFPDGRKELGTFSDIGLLYSFGTQRIIWDRFSLNIGVSIGTVLGLFSSNDPLDTEDIKRFATERLQGHFLFNFKGGIGVLLF